MLANFKEKLCEQNCIKIQMCSATHAGLGSASDLDSAQDEQWKQRQMYRYHHQICHLVFPESDLCRSVDDGDFHNLQLVSACFQFTQSQPLRSNAAIKDMRASDF